jgi:hypothetical protein
MLAYTANHNDVYFFFENDEINRLENGIVRGLYFNRKNMDITALLKASVSDKIHDMSIINKKYDEEGYVMQMHLLIWSKKYALFKEDKSADIHDGFRHIIFRNAADIKGLTMFEQFNYNQLKNHASRMQAKYK